MKKHTSKVWAAYMATVSALLLMHCARPIQPSGGVRDEIPPQVVRTRPDSAALYVTDKEVEIVFDEAIRKPTYGKEIYISPFIRTPKIIYSDNARRLGIQFEDTLLAQTTYVISLTNIADLNEGNQLPAYTLAFSTGSTIDSLSFGGTVQSYLMGQTAKDMSIMLFDADSLPVRSLKNKRPVYLAPLDKSGAFLFRYLRPGRYYILGVADKDQTNTWSTGAEALALASDSVIVLGTDTLPPVTLFVSLPDDEAPKLTSYAWIRPDLLSLRLDGYILPDQGTFVLTDTLDRDSVMLDRRTLFLDKEIEMLLAIPPRTESELKLHIQGAIDSTGNQLDTTLRLSRSRTRRWEKPIVRPPVFDPARNAWTLIPYRTLTQADTGLFALTDTTRRDSMRKKYPVDIQVSGLEVRVSPRVALSPKTGYWLTYRDTVPATSKLPAKDSTFRYPVSWLSPEDLGTLQGSVWLDSTYAGPVVVQLLNGQNAVIRTAYDTTFVFTHLPAGSYTARVILDADGNRAFSPGSLRRYRLPERLYLDPQKITIRANWDTEGHKIQIGAIVPQKTGSSGTPESDSPPAGRRIPGKG